MLHKSIFLFQLMLTIRGHENDVLGQFVVSQAIIPKIASGLRHLININDDDIHRILIENTPLTSSISGSA